MIGKTTDRISGFLPKSVVKVKSGKNKHPLRLTLEREIVRASLENIKIIKQHTGILIKLETSNYWITMLNFMGKLFQNAIKFS